MPPLYSGTETVLTSNKKPQPLTRLGFSIKRFIMPLGMAMSYFARVILTLGAAPPSCGRPKTLPAFLSHGPRYTVQSQISTNED